MQFLLKPELIQINLSCGELGLTPVEKMELECAVYGEEIVVSVKIARDAKARDLAKAIVDLKKGVNNRFDVDPDKLKLYLARKHHKWLAHDAAVVTLLSGAVDPGYPELYPSYRLAGAELIGPDFDPREGEIHIDSRYISGASHLA